MLFGTEFIETAGTGTVTLTLDFPVTSEVYGAGWAADTEGAQRDDIYTYLVNFDADSDGDFTDETWFPAAGIGGSTGSTDNAILRANGTGGSTAQASGVTIDDNDTVATAGTLSGKMVSVVNSDTASYTVTAAQARANTLFLTTNAATNTISTKVFFCHCLIIPLQRLAPH